MAAFYKYIKGYMSDGETTQYIFFNQGGGHDNRPYFSNSSDATGVDYFVSEKGEHTFEGNNTLYIGASHRNSILMPSSGTLTLY